MYVIFEDYLFMTQNFVNLFIGFGLIAIFLFIYFVRKAKGEKEYYSLIATILAAGFLLYKTPLFIDIPAYQNEKHEEHIGILSKSKVDSRNQFLSNGRRIIYTTTITVGNETFKIPGSYSDLSYYHGKEVTIHYLPRSKYIAKITTETPVNIPNK